MSEIPYDSLLLLRAGARLNAKSIKSGAFAIPLIQIARRHVMYMVRQHTCSHDGFNGRAYEIHKIFPNLTPAEIVAYGGPCQNPIHGAAMMWELWRKSPGHWSAANSRCRYYVYSLGFVNNFAYGIGLILT